MFCSVFVWHICRAISAAQEETITARVLVFSNTRRDATQGGFPGKFPPVFTSATDCNKIGDEIY